MDRVVVVLVLEGLRRFFVKSLIVIAVSGIGCFVFSKDILKFLLKAANLKVYYLSLPEVLLTSVQVAIFAGIFVALPAVIFLLWHELKGLTRLKPLQGYLFVISAVLLFYCGSAFCYYLGLPSGIGFLVGYQNETLKAMISVEKFTRFVTAMIFAFGITFEVPIILLVLGRTGILKSRVLTRTRRYAILAIVIAAALITPTPDVYNMMVLAVPMYVLYEIGILLMKIGERKDERRTRPSKDMP
jgi:sec-independent protein translocase protein TatC